MMKKNGNIYLIGLGVDYKNFDSLQNFINKTGSLSNIAVVIFFYNKNSTSEKTELLPENGAYAQGGNIIKDGDVLIIPTGKNLKLENNKMFLFDCDTSNEPDKALSFFWGEVAREYNEHAIAIQLADENPIGTEGLAQIRYNGGISILCPVKNMKNKNSNTPFDLILSPDEIVLHLKNLTQNLILPMQTSFEDNAKITEIFALVLNYSGHDFSYYKDNTINRRIRRQLVVNDCDTIGEYLELLKKNPSKIDELFKELLIGVTSFFRDEDAFSVLENKIIPDLIDNNSDNLIRVWNPGCSTGEESYSLAILFKEALKKSGSDCTIQIFATDINSHSIDFARKGVYSQKSVEKLSDERLKGDFEKDGEFYRVNKDIREMLIFSCQSLGKDPPFSRIDLVVCRNLLIYLESDLQSKIISCFYNSLIPGGYLFLGSAENLGQLAGYFTDIDKKWKIFRTRRDKPPLKNFNPIFFKPRSSSNLTGKEEKVRIENVWKDVAEERLLNRFTSPAVLVNRKGDILYSHGRISDFLQITSGNASLNVMTLAREGMKIQLAAGFRNVQFNKKRVDVDKVFVDSDGRQREIRIQFEPVAYNNEELYIIVFENIILSEEESKETADFYKRNEDYIRKLEDELKYTREYLEKTTDELDSTNEELKASNEELLATNEELHGSNEELESSKSELQAMNCELIAINNKLNLKNEALNKSNSDLDNFFNSTQIATIYLDQELKILRFTTAIEKIIRLVPADIGRCIFNFSHNIISGHDIYNEFELSIKEKKPVEHEVVAAGGLFYLMKILTYKNMYGKDDGIIVTFTDISTVKKAEQELDEAFTLLETSFEQSPAGILVVDCPQNRVKIFNSACSEILGITDSRTNYENINMSEVDFVWQDYYPNGEPVPYEDLPIILAMRGIRTSNRIHRVVRQDGLIKWTSTNGTPVYNKDGEVIAGLIIFSDITEEKESSERLLKSESLYRLMADQSNDLIYTMNLELDMLFISPSIEKLLGFTAEEYAVIPLKEKFTSNSFDMFSRKLTAIIDDYKKNTLKVSPVISIELEYLHKNKNSMWCESTLSLVFDENRSPSGYIVSARNIDIRKRTELELRESEEKFRTLADNVSFGILIYQNDRWIYSNKSACYITGYSKDEMLEMNYWDFVHPDFVDIVKERGTARQQGIAIQKIYDLAIITKKGEMRWIELYGDTILFNGQFAGMVAIVDITERKEQADLLKRNEEKYRSLFEAANDGIIIIDEYTIVDCNEVLAKMFGYTKDEIIGKRPDEFSPDFQQDGISSFEKAKEKIELALQGKPQTFEWVHMTKDKQRIECDISISSFEQGGQNFSMAIVRDVTEKNKILCMLKESEEKYRSTVELLPLAVFDVGLDGKIIYVNSTCYRYFGYTEADLKNGLNVFQMVPDSEKPRVIANIGKIMSGENLQEYEYIAMRKDMSTFPVEIHCSLVYNSGEPAGMRGVIIDTSEKRKFESEMERANRLESLGILAGGIAHDFNNILTAILGNISLARFSIASDHEIYNLLTEAEKASQRARNLTQQLLTFSKGGAPVMEHSDLRSIIRDSADFILRGSNITCVYNMADDLWMSEVDKGQISQVIQNLVINACQAMPAGGAIYISADNEIIGSSSKIPLSAGKYIKISVRDEGIGIDKQFLENIFDPYFTTKQKGNGLGLAICYSIIKKHFGHILVNSDVGAGSTFIIYLPANIIVHKKDEVNNPVNLVVDHKIKILFMDDEEMLRNLAKEMLTALGMHVSVAKDGEEALALFDNAKYENTPFELIIIDLTIPGGMGGEEFIREIRKRDTKVKTIVASGYSNNQIISNYKEYGFNGCIHKPYDVTAFIKVVQKVLNDNQS